MSLSFVSLIPRPRHRLEGGRRKAFLPLCYPLLVRGDQALGSSGFLVASIDVDHFRSKEERKGAPWYLFPFLGG